ncbi:BglG family transcription antiterminator [Mesobacillus zeae]|uniref:PRD domain-containing protein n=1 Tax=Mesobacillus zeae TaxID=1917180 RepID=A0A398AYN9_9BACI|nr:BglG family transcription antiterminator [Mesobacillus zeae]RID82682.1 PRD domain-containing protein [Mesobacillus zeae]
MSLDQRSTAILSHLIKAGTFVSAGELTEKFHISRRTVYYDIGKINDWLEDNQLPIVKHVRSAGFILEEEAAIHAPEKLGHLKTWHYEYSAKERKAWLAIYLTAREKALFLDDLMEKTRVSRNTTIEDLKVLKAELERFELSLDFERKTGYSIAGKEDDKRKAIVHYLHHVLPEQNWQSFLAKIPIILNHEADDFSPVNFEKLLTVQNIVSESEAELNLQFTDEFLYSLAFRLLLFCKRVAQGKKVSIDPIEKEVLQATKHYQAAVTIGRKLSTLFKIEFPEDEIFYITKHLLASRIQFSGEPVLTSQQHEDQLLAQIVTRMVTDFQKYACVFFQNREEIENNLMLHVKPAYYRIKYGLEFETEMTELIKKQYHDVFLLTKKSISHLEAAVGKSINDNEVALISMHFGGWMRKVGAKPAARKKALLVCNNGVGTSRLLLHQLEGLFSTVDLIGSVSLREFQKNDYDADFIISTIPMEESTTPVFVVNPILTEAEKETLLKKVLGQVEPVTGQSASVEALMNIIEKHASIFDQSGLQQELKQFLHRPARITHDHGRPSLSSLLQPEYIQVKKEAADWKDAIVTAAAPLLLNGCITSAYVEKMLANVEKLGPYIVIAPHVAIPHAGPEDGVNCLGMSLLKLQHAVSFSDQDSHDVRLLIVLAAIDGEAHLKALSQLNSLLSDENSVETLLQAKTPEKIATFIRVNLPLD